MSEERVPYAAPRSPLGAAWSGEIICGTCRHQWSQVPPAAGWPRHLACPACELPAGAPQVVIGRTTWWVSGHARERYAQRRPAGLGMPHELANVRIASRRERARINRLCPAGRERYVGEKVYWISGGAEPLVTVARVFGRAEYLVLTVWNLHEQATPPETIGRCEWCGLVSHHLIDGECPVCRELSVDATDAVLGLDGHCDLIRIVSRPR